MSTPFSALIIKSVKVGAEEQAGNSVQEFDYRSIPLFPPCNLNRSASLSRKPWRPLRRAPAKVYSSISLFLSTIKTTSLKARGPVPGQHIILGIKQLTVVNEFTPQCHMTGTFEDGIIEDPPLAAEPAGQRAWI